MGMRGFKNSWNTIPDLIITDLLLPDFGGIDMIEKNTEIRLYKPDYHYLCSERYQFHC